MKNRSVVKASLSLSPAGKRSLDASAAALGMKQQELLGRLLDWFQGQERLIQLIAVKQIPDGETGDIVELLMRRRDPKVADATLEVMVREVLRKMTGEPKAGRRKAGQ